jgi:hypothetical protein
MLMMVRATSRKPSLTRGIAVLIGVLSLIAAEYMLLQHLFQLWAAPFFGL